MRSIQAVNSLQDRICHWLLDNYEIGNRFNVNVLISGTPLHWISVMTGASRLLVLVLERVGRFLANHLRRQFSLTLENSIPLPSTCIVCVVPGDLHALCTENVWCRSDYAANERPQLQLLDHCARFRTAFCMSKLRNGARFKHVSS
jgi:hypothetical protein